MKRDVINLIVVSFSNKNEDLAQIKTSNEDVRLQQRRALDGKRMLKCCDFPQDLLRFEITESKRLSSNLVFRRSISSTVSVWDLWLGFYSLGFGVEG